MMMMEKTEKKKTMEMEMMEMEMTMATDDHDGHERHAHRMGTNRIEEGEAAPSQGGEWIGGGAGRCVSRRYAGEAHTRRIHPDDDDNNNCIIHVNVMSCHGMPMSCPCHVNVISCQVNVK
jgi:hypothetical protein